jgi:arylsulfatase A-like enzyme
MSTETRVSNVVLVTVDSLRHDAVETTGETSLTPEIAGLADDGVVFDNAFAHGNWTPFSFPSIFGSRPVFAESDDIGLQGTPVLGERLQDEGIRTGGFSAANGFLTDFWGYDRGFDVFDPFIAGTDASRYQRYLAAHPTVYAWTQLATSPFRRFAHRLRHDTDSVPFTDVSHLLDVERSATDFLAETDGPFFLWVHYMDTHTPYVPAPRYLRQVSDDQFATHRLVRAHLRTGLGLDVGEQTLADLRNLYAGAVRQVDASIGRLRTALAETGVADETALIVAGDHGEEFMEHGNLAHYPKLYDSHVHVPLIVSVPGLDSREVTDPVGLDAVAPTVCELLGVAPPDVWDGTSLWQVVDGDGGDDDPIISVAVRGDSVTSQPIPRQLTDGDLLVSARTAEWTYIENTETGEPELYHRGDDPEHQRDLLPSDEAPPAVVDHLAEAVERHASRLGGSVSDEDSADDRITDRLEALGYR